MISKQRQGRSRMVVGLVGLVGALTAQVAGAQSIPYEVSSELVGWNLLPNIATQTVVPTSYSLGYGAWDEGATAVPLPFAFPWFGRRFNTLWVYTNGFVSFDAPPTNAQAVNILGPPSLLPDPRNTPHNTIGVLWQDLDGTSMPEIRYLSDGTAPNRRVTVQVTGLRRSGSPGTSVEYQVRLEESGFVRVIYGPNNFGVAGATIGIEDAVGVYGAGLMGTGLDCGATCACAVRACGSTHVQPPAGSNSAFSIVIRPPLTAELIGAITGPPGAYPGASFTATVTVSNVGLGASGPFRAQVRLSPDVTIDASDTLLTTLVYAALPAAGSDTRVVTLTMPIGLPVARSYLGLLVDVDAQVMEAVETNNSARDPGGIVTGPDLQVSVATGLTSGPGETIDVVMSLRARGTPVVAPVEVELFLSTDSVFDAMDRSLGRQSFVLPDGFSLDQTFPVVLPGDLLSGSYRLLGVVDPRASLVELDETNNVGVSPGVLTLTLSDLQVTAVTSGPVAFRGLPFPVEARLANAGGGAARDFVACLVLSRNPLVSVINDTVLQRSGRLTTLGGETRTLRFEPVLATSTGTGTWNLAVVADCEEQVTESVEVNNTLRRDPTIRVSEPLSDLVPVEIRTASTGAAGEVLAVSVVVANQGVIAGAANLRFVLSTNPVATPSDRTLVDLPMPRVLQPGQELSFSAQVPMPGELRSGRYVIGAIVDPQDQVVEVDEANNVLSAPAIPVLGTGISVVSAAPPSAVVSVGYAWRFQALGGQAPYVWTIAWEGGRAPAGLSFDPALGELSGTPGSVGNYTLTVTARSSAQPGAERGEATYALLVTPPTLPLSVVSAKLPPALERENYTARLVAVGGAPPYRWELRRGAVPAGMSLVESGEVGGQPIGPGVYSFGVRVTDANGNTDEAELALDVVDPRITLSITTTDVPSGMVGEPYLRTFEVTGGTEPYRWRLEGGPIPGLRFDVATAQLAGTPTVAGSYSFVVEARDDRGLLDRNAYALRIFEIGELTIVTGRGEGNGLPGAELAKPYVDATGAEVRLRASKRSGGAAERVSWLLVLGSLPPGLLLDNDTGVLSGAPTTVGLYAFTVLATTPSGDRDRVTLAIQVTDPSVVPPPVESSGCGCVAASSARGSHALELLSWALLVIAGRRRRPGRVVFGSALLLGVVVLGPVARAQTVEYVVTTDARPYVPLTSGSPLVVAPGAEYASLPLPFDVYLYDRPVRHLEIAAAGVVGFDHALSDQGGFIGPPPRFVPAPNVRRGFVAPLWGDWCGGRGSFFCAVPPSANAGVFTRIDTPPVGPPSVVVEWRDVSSASDFTSPSRINFQLRIQAGFPAVMTFHYGAIVPGEGFVRPSQLQARSGLNSVDGQVGGWLQPCGGPAPCDARTLAGLQDQRVTLRGVGVRDLVAGPVTAPPQSFSGLPLAVRFSVASFADAPLGPFEARVLLVPASSTSTHGATRLWSAPEVTLAAFERRTFELELHLPPSTLSGRYRVALVVDANDAIEERSEANDLALSDPLRLLEPGPDFVVSDATAGADSASAGGTIPVRARLANRGPVAGAGLVSWVLSRNAAITATDRILHSETRTLGGHGEEIRDAVLTLPSELEAGTYYLGLLVDPADQVVELDETNNLAIVAAPIELRGGPLRILTQTLPPATLARPYDVRVELAGGRATPTLALEDGVLPRGIAFDEARRQLVGRPRVAGRFALGFVARDGEDEVRVRLALEVADPAQALTLVTRELPEALLGDDFSAQLYAVGGTTPLRWTLDGALPEGLTLSRDGLIAGMPTRPGPARFGVRVTDAVANTASVALALDVRIPGNLTIVAAPLEAARRGASYDGFLVAVGGRPPYRWAWQTGLVPGLTLTASGELVGRPLESGRYAIVVEVTDAAGARDTGLYALEVTPGRPLLLVADGLGAATVGQPYRGHVRVEGGERPFVWNLAVDEGALPPGLVVVAGDARVPGESTNDLVFAGTPTRAGLHPFTVRVQDAANALGELPLAIVVEAAPEPPPVATSGCGATSSPPSGGLSSLMVVAALSRRRVRRRA